MKAFKSTGPLDSVRTRNKAKHPDKNIFFQWIKIIANRIDVWDVGSSLFYLFNFSKNK